MVARRAGFVLAIGGTVFLASCRPDPVDPEKDLSIFEESVERALGQHLAPGSFELTYSVIDIEVRTDVHYSIDATINITAPTTLTDCETPAGPVQEIEPYEAPRHFVICPTLREAQGPSGLIEAPLSLDLPDSWKFVKVFRPDGNIQAWEIDWTGPREGFNVRIRERGRITSREVVVIVDDETAVED